MSSNYPPGVTGGEYEIAGPDREVTEVRTCELDDITIPMLDQFQLETLIGAIALPAGSEQSRLLGKIGEIKNYNVAHCPFEGKVDVQYYRHSSWWECPLCGMGHED